MNRAFLVTIAAAVLVPALAWGATALPIPSGIDISSNNHAGNMPINWQDVANSQQDFVLVKATEGTEYTNPFYAEDIAGAKEHGMYVGAYHYGRPNTDPIESARHFADVIKSAPATTMPPVLDIEQTDGVGVAGMQLWISQFMQETQRLTGQTPLIYTFRFFWEDKVGNAKNFTQYPLWLSAWQNTPPEVMPGGWDHMTFWQRSATGRISGILTDVDMSLFNGTAEQLAAFTMGSNIGIGGLLTPGTDFGGTNYGQSNAAILQALINLAEGNLLASADLVNAAAQAGIDLPKAVEFAKAVVDLATSGELPLADLEALNEGDYSLGDVLQLLDAAEYSARSHA
ncbi:MAG: glycoside hydrolase family 25 protein [Corynebacterium sp.]|nr:glycoside hydrolase family 25 protein [Corynebacterium sp.]